MSHSFKIVIVLLLAICIHEVASAKSKSESPLHTQTLTSNKLRAKLHPKAEKTDTLRPFAHAKKDVKMQVELTPGATPVPNAADVDVVGNADFDYVHDDQGNVLFDFDFQVNSLSGKGDNDTSDLYYSLSKANGLITLNISSSSTSNSSSDLDGCDGWWVSENIDLSNGDADNSKWFLNNCFIYDTNNGQVLSLNTINFKSASGQMLKGFTWVCNSRGEYWQFDFNSCEWRDMENKTPMASHAAVINFLQIN